MTGDVLRLWTIRKVTKLRIALVRMLIPDDWFQPRKHREYVNALLLKHYYVSLKPERKKTVHGD